MVAFSFRTLVLEGGLGGVDVTMDREQVRASLGPPDDWMLTRRTPADGSRSPIWRYGNFEVHFGEDDAITMLFTDYLHDSDAGPGRQLERWPLDSRGSPALGPQQLCEAIEGEGGRVQRGEDVLGRPVLEVVESGAELVFDRDHSDEPWRWTFIAVRAGGPASRQAGP